MKKFFSFVLLFAISIGSAIMLCACDTSSKIDTLMFTYDHTTYKSGANIVFRYQQEANFNKDTVKFTAIDSFNSKQNIDISELNVKYEYSQHSDDNFVEVNFFPFFEGETNLPACGIYKFTVSKDKATLSFTVTILQQDPVKYYSILFYSDTATVSSSGTRSYIIDAVDCQKISWKVDGMTEKEIQQLGQFPELYVMTSEQYSQTTGREDYNGTLIYDLYSSIFGTPGEYYIYGTFNETTNYKGGNTFATHLIVR